MTDQPLPVAGKDLRDRAVARLKQKRDFGSGIPGIVASTGADAELAHALHERQALRAEGMLDLLSLLVPRSVERPGRPLMTDTNRPTPRSRGEVGGIVRGPAVAVAPRTALVAAVQRPL